LIAESEGKIFLEVHQDIYNIGNVSLSALEQLVNESVLSDRINWPLAKAILKQHDGIARDVTLP
jgi:hypothetical protein